MATNPEEPEAQPALVQRALHAVSAPITDRTARVGALLALAAGLAALAPEPYNVAAAASAAAAAYEVGRTRR